MDLKEQMNGCIAVSLFCDIILLNTVDMHIERNASLEGVYFTHIIGLSLTHTHTHTHTHKLVNCQSVRFNQQFMNNLCLKKSNIFPSFHTQHTIQPCEANMD